PPIATSTPSLHDALPIYRLHHEDWLRTAQIHVRQNAGSRTAGCDGVTMRDFEKDLEGNLWKLREDLKAERFEPQPARRTYIRERSEEHTSELQSRSDLVC